MNLKLNIQEIVDKVAEKSGATKKMSESFLRAFTEAIEKSLSEDGTAKLKGFGTFKLTEIDERKSINVQTGEEVIIPAHKKVTFTPDKDLKDEINKPFAHLESYVLAKDGPVDPEESNADEDDETVETVTETAENETLSPTPQQEESQEIRALASEMPESTEPVVLKETEKIVEEEKTAEEGKAVEEEKIVEEEKNQAEEKVEETEIAPIPIESDEKENTEEEENTETLTNTDTSENAEESAGEELITGDSEEVDEKNDEKTEEKVEKDTDETVEEEIEEKLEEKTENNIDEQQKNREDMRQEENQELEEQQEEKKKSKAWIFILLLLLLLGALLYLYGTKNPKLQGIIDRFEQTEPSNNESATSGDIELSVGEGDPAAEAESESDIFGEIDPSQQQVTNAADEEASEEVIDEPKSKSQLEAERMNQTDRRKKFDKRLIAFMEDNYPYFDLSVTDKNPQKVTLTEGERLTLLALKYYGHKDYWVYIYYYNSDVIKNPNRIPAGADILIPKLNKTLVNGSEASLRAAADVAETLREGY